MNAYSQIIRYIDAHIRTDITLADLARAVSYSPHHIYKLFRVYSPYPVMEYIRRKKMYAALGELYTGRKIYDIALDYGFDTPAGFYKAFKSVFGCAPSAYRKGAFDMMIEQVKDTAELDAVLAFFAQIHPPGADGLAGDGKYSRHFWLTQWKNHPELLLFAKDGNDRVCGIIIGWVDGNSVTVSCDGVTDAYKDKGLHEALFAEIEKRIKQLGYNNVVLGILEGQEAFFATLGYLGKMLLQSEKYSVDELLAFNTQHGNYEVTGTSVYDGIINQVWLDVSLLDKGLQQHYEQNIGDCWVQIIVNKAL